MAYVVRMRRVYLADQTRWQYHLPPPHPLSSDTIQYLLIMSGLICKVAPGTTVAWRRQTGVMFLCVCVHKERCVFMSFSVVCVCGWDPQPVAALQL